METIRPQKQCKEENLYPVDGPEFQQFAHDVLDYGSSNTASIRQLPVWLGVPDSVRPPKEVQKGSV